MDLEEQLKKLNGPQLLIALKVIEEAERQKVNPELVLPLVAVESEFSHDKTSPKGAIGVMQLMPKTAKGLGVDPNDMDQNIHGGVKLIKQLSEHKNIGSDPYKILVGYNAGPDAEYFKTGNYDDLPKETQGYLQKAHVYYGDELPSPNMPERDAGGEEVPESQYGETKIDDQPMTVGEERNLRGEAGALGGIFGAGVGAVKAPVIGLAHRVMKALPKNAQPTPDQLAKLAAQIMQTNGQGGEGGQPSGKVSVPMGTKDAGRMAAGETGVMPYNYAKAAGLTDIEALQAVDMTKNQGGVHDLASKRREGMNRVNQIAPNQFAENPLFGGLLTQTPSVGGGPRASYAFKAPEIENGQVVQAGGLQPLPKAQPVSSTPAPARQPSIMQRAGTTAGNLAGTVAGSSPVMGGLAGYGALYNAQDAYTNWKHGDIPGAITSGLGSAASAASVIPKAAPVAGSASALIDADRRRKEQDYIGMLTSTIGAAAPYVAPFLLGPEVGIPVGVATAVGSPFANELKDYLQRGGDQTPAPKKAFRHRGFGLD